MNREWDGKEWCLSDERVDPAARLHTSHCSLTRADRQL